MPNKTKLRLKMIYKLTPPKGFGVKKVVLPASKSLSNRVLVINALSRVPQEISNLAECDDTAVMIAALANGNNAEMPVDVHGAGTAMRFLTAYFSLQPLRRTITGSARMQQRPITILVEALRNLGADIEYAKADGFPPLRVGGATMHGGEISLPADVSSQYISALLMIAPCLNGGLRLTLNGTIASRPYINMTLELMRSFGAKAEWTAVDTITVEQGGYSAKPYTVESDWSAASYWYELMALTQDAHSAFLLPALYENSLQGDSKGMDYFRKIGVDTSFSNGSAKICKGEWAETDALELDLGGEPDLAQTFVAACCGLGIRFRFAGLSNLRVKETDRIAALETELAKLGYVVRDLPDGTMYWDGERCDAQKDAVIKTYDDHRMAMSIAPLCIKTGEIRIENPEVVCKSYPRYWDDLRAVGFNVEEL